MKISQEDGILIKKSLSVKAVWCIEGCCMNFPTRVGNLKALTVC